MSDYYDGPIWKAFGLTRASYAVWPRRVLQSMPVEWQRRFVELAGELNETFPDYQSADYTVLTKSKGKFIKDPMREYRHTGPLPKVDG